MAFFALVSTMPLAAPAKKNLVAERPPKFIQIEIWMECAITGRIPTAPHRPHDGRFLALYQNPMLIFFFKTKDLLVVENQDLLPGPWRLLCTFVP